MNRGRGGHSSRGPLFLRIDGKAHAADVRGHDGSRLAVRDPIVGRWKQSLSFACGRSLDRSPLGGAASFCKLPYFGCSLTLSQTARSGRAQKELAVITRSGLQAPFFFKTCSSFRQGSCQVSSFASAARQPHVHAWHICACSSQCSSAVTCSCCSCLLLLSSSSLLLLSTPGRGVGVVRGGGGGRVVVRQVGGL